MADFTKPKGVLTWTCVVCERKFASSQSRVIHLRQTHGVDPSVKPSLPPPPPGLPTGTLVHLPEPDLYGYTVRQIVLTASPSSKVIGYDIEAGHRMFTNMAPEEFTVVDLSDPVQQDRWLTHG